MMMAKKRPALGAIVNKNGVTFGVWAPFAENVFVTGNFNGWGCIQMEKDQHGYWQAEVEGAEAGSEYKFIVVKDGNEMYRNDPRSLQLMLRAMGARLSALLSRSSTASGACSTSKRSAYP